jgi:hypothetical protein
MPSKRLSPNSMFDSKTRDGELDEPLHLACNTCHEHCDAIIHVAHQCVRKGEDNPPELQTVVSGPAFIASRKGSSIKQRAGIKLLGRNNLPHFAAANHSYLYTHGYIADY